QLGHGELAGEDVGAGGHRTTAGHDFDDVDAVIGAVADGGAEFLRPGRLATHVPAVPTRDRDRWAGGEDSRLSHPTEVGEVAVDGPARPAVDDNVAPVAQVAYGRDPGPQVLIERGRDHVGELVLAEMLEPVERAIHAVRTQVDMHVDESR